MEELIRSVGADTGLEITGARDNKGLTHADIAAMMKFDAYRRRGGGRPVGLALTPDELGDWGEEPHGTQLGTASVVNTTATEVRELRGAILKGSHLANLLLNAEPAIVRGALSHPTYANTFAAMKKGVLLGSSSKSNEARYVCTPAPSARTERTYENAFDAVVESIPGAMFSPDRRLCTAKQVCVCVCVCVCVLCSAP